MTDADWNGIAYAIARVWMGGMMFAHGFRHLQSVRSGPGMANWFESLGMRNGPLQAWNVTLTELLFGALLVIGFMTPLAYAGAASIGFVALVTNHRKNGFFINNPGEGYEYVATIGVLGIALGGLGPGRFSLDAVIDNNWVFDIEVALPVTAAVAIGGTVLFLGAFWRPPAASTE